MLKLELKNNILCVTETKMTFNKDIISYWYYDIVEWKSSVLGKQLECPTFPMSEEEILWVKKHYIPKIN